MPAYSNDSASIKEAVSIRLFAADKSPLSVPVQCSTAAFIPEDLSSKAMMASSILILRNCSLTVELPSEGVSGNVSGLVMFQLALPSASTRALILGLTNWMC
ncbi:MAG: hypothetical protein BWY72_01775 [Bacteroidetes bacterium ADurb.Bin416]|nr:MAG: hypothetical protein BWY72_01775 [Bacteroidetes bacterium ADurb.Bin416]